MAAATKSTGAIDSNKEAIGCVRRDNTPKISLPTDGSSVEPQGHVSPVDDSFSHPKRIALICPEGMDRVLAHAPEGSSGGGGSGSGNGSGNGSGESSRPRRVVVPGSSYIASNLFDDLLAVDKGELLEVPRDWVIQADEEPGEWVAEDGMVYSQLGCYCYSCTPWKRSLGVKVLAAGLHGADLVGRAWFVPEYVEIKGVDFSASPEEVMLPAHVAKLESLRVPRVHVF